MMDDMFRVKINVPLLRGYNGGPEINPNVKRNGSPLMSFRSEHDYQRDFP